MTPRISEKALQEQICQYIALSAPGVKVYQFGKPGGHAALRGALPVGWPDLLLLNRGTLSPEVLFVEVKAPGGKLSEGQERMRRELLDAGAHAYVCYSVEQMGDILRQHGVSLRCQP